MTAAAVDREMDTAADLAGCRILRRYSGSGMHGRTCLAVEGPVADWTSILLHRLADNPDAVRTFALLIRDAKLDTAKRRKVLYFPHFKGDKMKLTKIQKELFEKMKNGYLLVHDLYSARWIFMSPDGVPLKRLTVLTAAALARQPGVRRRRGVINFIYYFEVEK